MELKKNQYVLYRGLPLVRDGDNTKINPYDLYALELALKVKEQKECNVKE